jgi:arabinose-5-phosphate isomerase
MNSSAVQTIEAERDAIGALIGILHAGFADACQTIADLPGKLVVTGMGKSGWIGQKISATLRSTGQPSVFLDPAQALHGDMGMLAFGDGLLAISNSGETTEVVAVARYCQAHQIPVIVITRNEHSELCEMARHPIIYPLMPEGCPIQRAPMASAMQQLAIGDAIASELMAARGFTQGDFLALHHGGYLGRVIAEAT